ncbi:uncharacterized protein ARMOST_14562 [Armillaria ostoyae]|uniref:Uncharacterized protein n=1 Tax=Armillaria ostoyae TaxID=47428 RepID=A0A284QK76_ARMOS|nr:uncharacterized protein ARMOST_00109 [Armillaria ostoyae]SJL11159.1 uncharacterized protein ARMOST_14562 [Armillaria ostoyae]
MPVVPASSSRSKPSSKNIKPSSRATKPSSKVIAKGVDIKPASKTAQAKPAPTKPRATANARTRAQDGPVPSRQVLAPRDTNKPRGQRFLTPQTSDNVEPEDAEDDIDEGSENEEQENFEEGEESANEAGYGSLEDDIRDESEGEVGGEGDGEREGGEVGQKRRKNTQEGQRKQKYRRGYSKRQNWVLSMCHTVGKVIPRVVSLFTPVDDIMWAGARHSNKALALKIEIKDHPYTTPNQKSFAILAKILERDMTIWEALGCFPKNEIGMKAMIKEFRLGMKESRGTDTNKIRYDILTLCLKDPVNDVITPPKPVHKTGQGFNHVDTGRLLCPQIHLEKFNKSDRFLYDLANGKVKVIASEWPSFLYDQDLYDPEDEEIGLLKGYLLLRVYLHIFCSNGDPTKQDGPKRGSIAKIHGISVITGRQIAYAACQARYALSSKDGWTEQDGAFDLPLFYKSIVDLFESHPDDEWALETLAWWNEQVYGDPNGRTDTDKPDDSHPPDSTVARMAARRDARAKARAEAASADLDAKAAAAALEDENMLEYRDENDDSD